jgi:hypothetical protein
MAGAGDASRPDPLGKRALFGVPSEAPTPDASTVTLPVGKRALYSGAGPEGDGGSRLTAPRGAVTVECQRCQQRSQIGLVDFLILQFPFGAWLPRGRFDRRMTCPSCRKRAWCSVTLRRA